ncbi:cyanocobalamin reductase / alkylcobalamin dealkylase-like [Mercenaria mercenaria]|uniref:cyanocobalamin reductase / alkylcobalamin dealkylase-like n=1 Tax=Mercenaria mercenaria TaxID=6596 RepID=UPI00234E5BB9|nr:cyanocobalamin reductase / alkylcobalamin dealkylase-like [Mercenaria mercenaria]
MSPSEIAQKVKTHLCPYGFEAHEFKIGWYNEQVGDNFKLPYEDDTMAILIISTPDMFDKSLLPYILRTECPSTGDMLDHCVAEHFNNIKKEFCDCDIEAMHDFELLPSRRPKILVQTAGHVSGAAYYYQRKDVQPDPWDEKTKIFGVSIHPKYGGWFALRGVLIFKNIKYPGLLRRSPVDIVRTYERKKELLERFNFHWQDWTFRDIIPVEQKYSDDQKQYFETLPKDRLALIQEMKCRRKCTDLE